MTHPLRPLQAAILFGVPMQLPTLPPTPAPDIPLSDIERIINTASNQAKELSLQQMTFVVLVLLVVFGIAFMIWLIRRPNKPAAEVTAVEAMAGVLTTVQKQAEANERTRIEQNDKFIETATLMNDGVNRNADNTQSVNQSVDRLATHIEQLASRETARDKTIQSMSSALDTMVSKGSQPLRDLIVVVGQMVEKIDHMQCRQDDLITAIEVFYKGIETCEKKKEDTGNLPAIVEPLDDTPESKAS